MNVGSDLSKAGVLAALTALYLAVNGYAGASFVMAGLAIAAAVVGIVVARKR